MNDHDLALIAQLADGTIDPKDEPAARALLESSGEARAEYDAQLTALAAIRAAGPALLSPVERSALRESLITQLGLETAPEPQPARRRRAVPWGGLAVAAAALVGVVVLAPLLSLLSTGSDSASDTIAGALEAPAADAPAATGAGDAGLPAEERSAPAETDDQDAPLGALPAQTTAPSPAALFFDGLPYLGTIGVDELPELESELQSLSIDDASQWRLSLAGRDGAAESEAPLLDRFFARDGCAAAIPPGFAGEAVALAEVSNVTVVIYRLEPSAGAGGPVLLLVELDTCSELAGSAGGG